MKPLGNILSASPSTPILVDVDQKVDRGFAVPVAAVCVLIALSQAHATGWLQFVYEMTFVSVLLGAVHVASRRYQPRLGLKPVRPTRPGHDRSSTDSEQLSNEDLFRSAFNHAAGMAIVAPNGKWLTVNPAICQTLGYRQDELLTRSFQDMLHPDDLGPALIHLDKLLNGDNHSSQLEQRYIHKLGHTVWMLVTISLIRGSQSDPLYLVCQFQDITRRKEAEDRLVHDVFHDGLTGLPNRALFMDRLRLTMERSRRRKDRIFSVLFLDLDDFKTVNDSMGHMIGDQLLMEVARRLKSCLRTTDTVARLGGDEFTILLEDLSCESESLRIVERFQKELARPFKFADTEVSVTASIGIACNAAGNYESADEILRDADAAMYRAKTAGKGTYEIVDTTRLHQAQQLDSIAPELSGAIERGELQLVYQPIVCLESGTLLGVEALARWQHPHQGLIGPSTFIPVAERSGSIAAVENWVLREACAQLKVWETQFPACRLLNLSVNVSVAHLIQPEVVDRIVEILQAAELDPGRLKLELTESVLMQDVDTAAIVLDQLQALGIEAEIDDFGTGYSSLSYLHQLPVTAVKIDASFVKGLSANGGHREIIKSIVAMAKSLRMKVIAEGVETLEQLTQLRRLKCDAAQGFLFAKPISAEGMSGIISLQKQWQTIMISLNADPGNSGQFAVNLHQIPLTGHEQPRLRAV